LKILIHSQIPPREVRITMNIENEKLTSILKQLEKKYHIRFSYNENEIDLSQRFSISVKEKSLQVFLNKLFNDTEFRYKLLSNHVVIYKSTSLKTKKRTINGYVIDKTTGERLIGATVYTNNLSAGAISNNFGFFSFQINIECTSIICSYVGYSKVEIAINSIENFPMTIELTPSLELKEVIVHAGSSEIVSESSSIGEMVVSVKQIRKLPSILGESDVIKVAQLLPGVTEGSEGNAGLYIRGGNIDQNLVLIDDVPVFNPNHLFGFVSVFNPDALKSFKVIKGGFPARYGGRLSSVIDLRTKEGNSEKITGSAGIGILSSKFSLEGPIKFNKKQAKSTFIVSARRSNLGLIVEPFIKEFSDYDKSTYSFYDINAKLTYTPTSSHRFYLSYYKGSDKGASELRNDNSTKDITNVTSTISNVSWGNHIASFRWNWLLTSKLFSNLTIAYSEYFYENENSRIGLLSTSNDSIKKTTKNYSLQNSGIENISITEDFNFYASNALKFRFGYGLQFNKFNTGNSLVKFQTGDQEAELGANENYSAREQTAYLENIISFPRNVKTNIGIRYSGFFTGNTYYSFFEPRISTQWNVANNVSLKGGYGQLSQYVHLLSFSRISLSNDIWVPVTEKIKPGRSEQFSLALSIGVGTSLRISVEGFYKNLFNLIEYKEGAILSESNSWQDKVESGNGSSKGIEILVDKYSGKFNGWLSYTFAKSDRVFHEINQGNAYPFKYSRTHDLKATLMYQVSKNWHIASTIVLRSGHYETVPVEKFASTIRGGWDGPNNPNFLYKYNRNNFRFPLYKRVDLAISWSKQYRLFQHSISFGAYNIFNFKNAYKYYIEENFRFEDKTNEFVSTKININEYYLFTILPSLNYTINF